MLVMISRFNKGLQDSSRRPGYFLIRSFDNSAPKIISNHQVKEIFDKKSRRSMKLESLMIKNAQNRESLREDEDCSSQR
jgi:hypothetical protein